MSTRSAHEIFFADMAPVLTTEQRRSLADWLGINGDAFFVDVAREQKPGPKCPECGEDVAPLGGGEPARCSRCQGFPVQSAVRECER